jgi:hypothetical protein
MRLLKYLLVFSALFLVGCGSDKDEGAGGDASTSAGKEGEIRSYNLSQEQKLAGKRFPCDTLALKEFILNNYPAGTYLVDFDRTYTTNVPKAAVVYYKNQNSTYVFGVVAKSKPGERFIETKNVTGYSSSFINLDSTKLGTAFFWLTLFECNLNENTFNVIWESEVPIHGGFNKITVNNWRPKNCMYISLNYMDGIISGNRNYNFFLVNGLKNPPHLLETYEGLTHKRTMANINNDKYPDYFEYRFSEGNIISIIDSIPFLWDTVKRLYISPVNKRWFRHY